MSGQIENYKNISEWEVLTPTGFKSFDGIKKVKKEYSIKLITETGKEITCSGGHQLYIQRNIKDLQEEMFAFADTIEPLIDKIKNKENIFETIISIEKTEEQCELYDLVNVDDGYEYYANDLLSHNCAHIENFGDLWTGLQPTLSCVVGDTLILTDNGFEKIEDYHKGYNIGDYFDLKIPIYGKNGMEETSHGYVSPESDTLIIKTKHGHMVEVTLKHPLYIQNTEISEGGEMIQAKKLSLGDKLRIQIGMKCYGKKSLSETDAKNIGIYHGNKLLVDNKLDVPNDILSANKKTFDCFMKGLLKTGAKENKETINDKLFTISTVSEIFARKLNLLLHNDGYKSNIIEQYNLYTINIPFKETNNEEFYWDEIVSITPSKNKTYDFTVPKTHSFLQNGILGSNTGGSAILISSPLGVGNTFHSIWSKATDNNFNPEDRKGNQEGSNKFYAIELPWTVHPERDEEWYEQQCAELMNDPRRIAQELLCLTPETLITTKAGVKSIFDIKIGDEVLTHNGRYRKVTKKFERDFDNQNEKIYQISTPGNRGTKINITENHPLFGYFWENKKYDLRGISKKKYLEYAENNDKKINSYPLSFISGNTNLSTKHFSNLIHPKFNLNEFLYEQNKHIDLYEMCKNKLKISLIDEENIKYHRQKGSTKKHIDIDYDFGRFLGLFLSEGCIDKRRVSFAFHHDEMDTLGLFVKNYFNKYNILYHDNKRSYSKCYTITTSNKFVIELIKQYINGKYSLDKTINMDLIARTNIDVIKGLLAGIFEGDGSHPVNGNYTNKMNLVCVNDNLLSQVKTLLTSFGIYARIGYWNNKRSYLSFDGINSISVKHRNIKDILENYSSKDFEKNTSRTYFSDRFGFFGKIQYKEINYTGKVYNIEVEEDNSYVVDNCLTVHNCGFNASGNNFIENATLDYLRNNIKTPIAKYGPNNDMYIWEYANSGDRYIISADVARGDADDYSGMYVINANTNVCVAEYKGKMPPDRYAEFLVDVAKKYNNGFIVNEINNVGIATSYALKSTKYPNIYYEKMFNGSLICNNPPEVVGDLVPGFNTNAKSRNEILVKFEASIRNKEIQIFSERLIKELDTFIWDGKKAKAMKGYNDDLIMALAIGVNFIEWGKKNNYEGSAVAMAMLQAMSKDSRSSVQFGWGNSGQDLPMRGGWGNANQNPSPAQQNRFGNYDWFIKLIEK